MEALTQEEIQSLDCPTEFTNVFRKQVGTLLDVDLSDTADLPVCGTTPGKNMFAKSLGESVPENIYSNIICDDGSFPAWIYRFGFTPRALNAYTESYERIHGRGSFPITEFKRAIRTAKNCGYKIRSRQRNVVSQQCSPHR